RIEPLGLYLINRHQRYADDCLDANRYHKAWKKTAKGEAWPDHLQREQKTAASEPGAEFTMLVQQGLQDTDPGIKRALELFGNPELIGLPVHYPLNNSGRMEIKGFKWFVDNDIQQHGQHLASITANTIALPTLEKN
ncbi:MAG TPA: hypothetical protein DEF07_07405, partial [Nitrosomonas sp.]|nr:hypothetical protein [Nitrosomonas sp.]